MHLKIHKYSSWIKMCFHVLILMYTNRKPPMPSLGHPSLLSWPHQWLCCCWASQVPPVLHPDRPLFFYDRRLAIPWQPWYAVWERSCLGVPSISGLVSITSRYFQTGEVPWGSSWYRPQATCIIHVTSPSGNSASPQLRFPFQNFLFEALTSCTKFRCL